MTVGVCVSICSQADELNKCETSRDELKINIILNTHTALHCNSHHTLIFYLR